MPFGSILAAWSSLGSYFGCLGGHCGCLGPHFGDLGHHFGGLGYHFGGLGRHFGGLGRYLGHGLGPEEAWRRQNGLDCTLMQAGAWFCQDPGIQGIAQVGGDLMLWGPTINLTLD